MPRARVNDIELEYDTFGNPADAPLLLIMGLGAQMILWEEKFCGALAACGFFVIRFDNRDIGLSTKLDAAGMPDVFAAMQTVMQGGQVAAPYTLDEMADDAVGLLDALGIERAHVVGASMGGMIAQVLAIRHPERVRSLISIMSTTGDPALPPATPEAMSVLMTPLPQEREANIERTVAAWRVIGSAAFFEEEHIREQAARWYDRSAYPVGVARQLTAILASPSRKQALGSVKVPTLVIHGAEDPLIPLAAGRDTAEGVPGAELLVIEKMGHDLPRALWPRIIDAISRTATRADRDVSTQARAS